MSVAHIAKYRILRIAKSLTTNCNNSYATLIVVSNSNPTIVETARKSGPLLVSHCSVDQCTCSALCIRKVYVFHNKLPPLMHTTCRPHISDSGSCDVSVSSVSLSVSAVVGADSGGHPTVKASSCSLDIGHLDITFHGGAR